MRVLPVSTLVGWLGLAAAWTTPPRQVRTPRQVQPTLTATSADAAHVLFVVPDTTTPSTFGASSPRPFPTWHTVATHLSSRLGHFDERIQARVVVVGDDAQQGTAADIVLALGVTQAAALGRLVGAVDPAALLTHECSADVAALGFVDTFRPSTDGRFAAWATALAPWSRRASGQRLAARAATLLSRDSSEDTLYALLFVLHAHAIDIEAVRSDINPTWEKGPLRNAREFYRMVSCCGPQIFAALGDPETKKAIDLLDAGDVRDQVGSYRVIVSFESAFLEDFSLCILQQNNCFGCTASIPDLPRVPLQRTWRGQPVDADAARQLFIGHLEHSAAHPVAQGLAWSWKIVCGANPAYDAFPAQHQIFYPSGRSSSLWYDPVFKVETVDGRNIWTKRHYRCTPRTVDGAESSHGAWTLTTLDNGIISKEHWTTVDAADDLSWAIFHYSGAAAAAGQAYSGALLCSADGLWPRGADGTVDPATTARIEAGFRACGLELFEMYGHGPPESALPESYMWSAEHGRWAQANPPPLTPIGDVSVTAWRKSERARELATKALQ